MRFLVLIPLTACAAQAAAPEHYECSAFYVGRSGPMMPTGAPAASTPTPFNLTTLPAGFEPVGGGFTSINGPYVFACRKAE